MNLTPEIQSFIKEHEGDDVRLLALKGKKNNIDLNLAIRQIAGRKIAKEKIPTWYANDSILYPKHLSLEQCSSEHTARYKSSLFSGNSMTDLTGGLGVDFFFLSKNFEQARYVEKQAELAELAFYNFNLLNLKNVNVINIDAVDYLASMFPSDLIYIDPARRDNIGKKTVLIEDCTPNILEIEHLLDEKAKQIVIKLSPMLDISLAIKSLKGISHVHIISLNNECKELLFIKDKENKQTQFHCVNILNSSTDKFSFYKEGEENSTVSYVNEVGTYLYEPNSSILKAGAYKSVANGFYLSKLHPSSHLYTSDKLYSNFQGRKFVVENVCSLNKKELKECLKNIKQANITTRNFPISVDEVRKKTGLKDGGDIYIFASTLADERKVLIICRKV